MANLALQALRNLLMDALQLAVGCAFPLIAGIMKKRGISLKACVQKNRLFTIFTCTLGGMLLPAGPFGAVPAVAALWLCGLELPLALPLLISNFLFSMYMPLTYAVFDWGENIPRIALAFLFGFGAGIVLSHYAVTAKNTLRASAFAKLFSGQSGNRNYLQILRDYFKLCWPYLLAAAVLQAGFSAFALHLVLGRFFTSGLGLTAALAILNVNVSSPLLGTALSILGRLVDFSALAALALLLRFKSLCKLYACYLVLALLLFTCTFIK